MMRSATEPLLLGMRKANAVYRALQRSILLSEIAPGEALVEQTIAHQMGCSQEPVQEALMHLDKDESVERRSYKGTIVSKLSVEVVA